MSTKTEQMAVWQGEFGAEYTDRNLYHPDELDAFYLREYGISAQAMNAAFLGAIARDARILEVGANVGNQLEALQRMGFSSLYGIELQSYAVELSKSRTKGLNIIQGSAFDVPFKDGFFDLVYTSGVLIHLSPESIGTALDEIHRCTKRYIWGFEYYAEQWKEIPYRGHGGLMWKTDYAKLFTDRFPDLVMVRREVYPYLGRDLHDIMYLLEKR